MNGTPIEERVLVDTCFLISLVNTGDSLHANAEDYFRWLLSSGTTLYMSIITLSEFQEKQDELQIIENFKVLPFGLDDVAAQHAKFPREIVNGSSGDERVGVKDDIKILSTCFAQEVPVVLSSDSKLLGLATSSGLRVIDFKVPLHTYLGQLPLA